jgi:hypothetical protein
MLPHKITRYLRSRAIQGPWRLNDEPSGGFAGAVVIPALAESANLFATLRSLAENPPEFLSRMLVLVVVNHREDAPDEDKSDNLRTLEILSAGDSQLTRLNLAWVDAASHGLELPLKKGGVGLARKIGFDLALSLLDFTASNPFLAALDADTLVQPDYLPALADHFLSAAEGGAVIPFAHQEGGSPVETEAIRKYEIFLRSYVLGLSTAGSPYAFHTVGSAMACTAGAYAGMGGMNTRAAAEDFYFLQQLKKTVGIAQVRGTVVRPSARASHRVPFGTGRSITRVLAGDEDAVLFYRPECFEILKRWLSLVADNPDAAGKCLRTLADEISPALGGYLDDIRFVVAWEKLRGNSTGRLGLLAAFHSWFDALRTLRLIHHLSDGSLPRENHCGLVSSLLEWAELAPVGDPDAQLAILRNVQTMHHAHERPPIQARQISPRFGPIRNILK